MDGRPVVVASNPTQEGKRIDTVERFGPKPDVMRSGLMIQHWLLRFRFAALIASAIVQIHRPVR